MARFSATFAAQVVGVAVGWQVYAMTSSPFDLGLVGLVQFVPALLLVLVSGNASDRYNRRAIMALGQFAEALATGLILLLTASGVITVPLIFALLFVIGIARAFTDPAATSLVPNLVPPEDLAGAIALSSTSWQVANILGPVAGGLLYGLAAGSAYAVAFALLVAATATIMLVPRPAQKTTSEPRTWANVLAGFHYIWNEKVVLGAISLDLFAVLLGGATALLPAYVRDILHVGPWGLGRAALRHRAGRGRHGGVSHAAPPARSRRRRHVHRRRPLRRLHRRLRPLARGVAVGAGAGLGRCRRHDQRLRAQHVDPVMDARRRPRPRQRRQQRLRRRLQRARQSSAPAAWRRSSASSRRVVVGGIGTLVVAALWAWQFPDIRRVRHLRSRDQSTE